MTPVLDRMPGEEPSAERHRWQSMKQVPAVAIFLLLGACTAVQPGPVGTVSTTSPVVTQTAVSSTTVPTATQPTTTDDPTIDTVDQAFVEVRHVDKLRALREVLGRDEADAGHTLQVGRAHLANDFFQALDNCLHPFGSVSRRFGFSRREMRVSFEACGAKAGPSHICADEERRIHGAEYSMGGGQIPNLW